MYKEILSNKSIAISVSESSDMPVLGFDAEHLNDAMTEIARHLLALGACLVYGGDLRAHGFSNLLFELVARHSKDAIDDEGHNSVINYMAWPVHMSVSSEDIERVMDELSGASTLSLLNVDGELMSMNDKKQLPLSKPEEIDWLNGLSAMRSLVTNETFARIVIGGKTENYMGRIPGIAEEILISFNQKKPIYILGGFGGCARDIAEVIGLVKPWHDKNYFWNGLDDFRKFSKEELNNGLTDEENSVLAKTPHIDQAIGLVLKGLVSLIGNN